MPIPDGADFESYVGQKAVFFVPKTQGLAPTCTVLGPSGLDTSSNFQSATDNRWGAAMPWPFPSVGNYTVTITEGLAVTVYITAVTS